MERVLSPYNLYLFKFCEFLKKIHNFVYDETIVLDRLLQAEEKAIESVYCSFLILIYSQFSEDSLLLDFTKPVTLLVG